MALRLIALGAPPGASSALSAALAEALAARQLEVSWRQGGRDPTGTVLLFDQPGDELRARLAEAQRGGSPWILAIACGAPLPAAVAWQLLAAGASDVLRATNPEALADHLVTRLARAEAVDQTLASPLVTRNLVGESLAWRRALRRLVEVGRFTQASVLLCGESGTGKELAARLLHTLDARPGKGELVILDCTTIVPELSGSEFFGHEKGAFTNAVSARDGAFALADGGTLFLDEVGELPTRLQAELLRVVQEGTYKRVGSGTWQKARFRLICATNRDLTAEAAAGRFRRDLFYRLATWTVRLPPLAERREDVPALARHFLAEALAPAECPELDGAVLDYLMAREYPGNVRDLRQLTLRIAQRHLGRGAITVGDVPEEDRPALGDLLPAPEGPGLGEAVRQALRLGWGLKEVTNATAEAAVEIALAEEGGNVPRAARRLGVTDRALQMRLAGRKVRVPMPPSSETP